MDKLNGILRMGNAFTVACRMTIATTTLFVHYCQRFLHSLLHSRLHGWLIALLKSSHTHREKSLTCEQIIGATAWTKRLTIRIYLLHNCSPSNVILSRARRMDRGDLHYSNNPLFLDAFSLKTCNQLRQCCTFLEATVWRSIWAELEWCIIQLFTVAEIVFC